MFRLTIVWLLLLAGTSIAAPPNVVFILVDDLGYADLGCTGARDIRTPNIDRLARDGARLTQSYAAAPVCSPTRAALMTGRYPQRNAGFDWVVRYVEKDRGLAPTGRSLPRLLGEAGYDTALVGKWHLGYKPEFGPRAHGFGRFFGFLAADLDFWSHRDALGDPGLYENETLVEKPGYLTDLFTDRAVDFLREPHTKPFFLELAYNAPHWPFQRPDRPDDIRDKDTYGLENGTRADYVAMVERMDAGVGRVLAALDELKLTDNTLVIFTNDNGGDRLSDNSPFFHGKYSLWEGGIRVPAIVRWPGHIRGGTEIGQVVTTMDWTATLLAAAGAKSPDDLEGIDVMPMLTGKSPAQPRTLYWRLARPDTKHGQRAVRHGDWKLIYDREVELLFNLAKDPTEHTNLAWREPAKLKELHDLLEAWNKTLPEKK
jgi:arylsulfatase A-like enzyme